jgi:aspartate/methionine/tyrosine aminotransferase
MAKVARVSGPPPASGEGFVRCSYATSLEHNRLAMQRIGEFVTEVRR